MLFCFCSFLYVGQIFLYFFSVKKRKNEKDYKASYLYYSGKFCLVSDYNFKINANLYIEIIFMIYFCRPMNWGLPFDRTVTSPWAWPWPVLNLTETFEVDHGTVRSFKRKIHCTLEISILFYRSLSSSGDQENGTPKSVKNTPNKNLVFLI